MTEERIHQEHSKLLHANLEAHTAHIFYLEQSAKLTEEIRNVYSKKEEVDVDELQKLPEKERWTTVLRMKQRIVRFESAMDLLALIERQRDKAKRKCNETQQRLESFCKHHGIENPPFEG